MARSEMKGYGQVETSDNQVRIKVRARMKGQLQITDDKVRNKLLRSGQDWIRKYQLDKYN